MMYNILVVFPHGIGDAVMATPAFRALRKKYPQARIDIAVQLVLRNSGLLNHCPYFDNIYTIHNPWYSVNYEEGMDVVQKQIDQLVDFNQYQEVKWVYHRQDKQDRIHAVFLTAKELEVELERDTDYEVFVSEEAEAEALSWLKQHGYSLGNYAFIHASSSDLKKNISSAAFKEMIPEHYQDKVVIVGESFDISEYPIGFAITLLKHAGFTSLVDSVFVHCSDALHKDIDIHLTTSDILELKRPLHITTHRIIEKEFTKSNILKHKIQRAYHRLRPKLKTKPRSWHYSMMFKTAKKRSIVNWVTQCLNILCESSQSLIYIVGLAVKVIEHQYIITKPYVFYLKVDGIGCQLLEVESIDPLPSKGIQLFLLNDEEKNSSVKTAIQTIQRSINQLVTQRMNKEWVWFGQYNIEKQKIADFSNVTNEPIRSMIHRQEPFISDTDVSNFFQKLFSASRR